MIHVVCGLLSATPVDKAIAMVGVRMGSESCVHPWEFGLRKAKGSLLNGDSIDGEGQDDGIRVPYRRGVATRFDARDPAQALSGG